MNNKGFWKIGFFIISFILLIAVGVLAYLFGRGDLNLNNSSITNSQVIENQEIVPSSTPNTFQEIEAIKNAVYKKTGLTRENADVVVDQYTVNFAKGGIKEKEAIGGAYFIAAKVNDEWICVYDGQSHPSCEQIELYDFPKEMVPECLNEANKVVER